MSVALPTLIGLGGTGFVLWSFVTYEFYKCEEKIGKYTMGSSLATLGMGACTIGFLYGYKTADFNIYSKLNLLVTWD